MNGKDIILFMLGRKNILKPSDQKYKYGGDPPIGTTCIDPFKAPKQATLFTVEVIPREPELVNTVWYNPVQPFVSVTVIL